MIYSWAVCGVIFWIFFGTRQLLENFIVFELALESVLLIKGCLTYLLAELFGLQFERTGRALFRGLDYRQLVITFVFFYFHGLFDWLLNVLFCYEIRRWCVNLNGTYYLFRHLIIKPRRWWLSGSNFPILYQYFELSNIFIRILLCYVLPSNHHWVIDWFVY